MRILKFNELANSNLHSDIHSNSMPDLDSTSNLESNSNEKIYTILNSISHSVHNMILILLLHIFYNILTDWKFNFNILSIRPLSKPPFSKKIQKITLIETISQQKTSCQLGNSFFRFLNIDLPTRSNLPCLILHPPLLSNM